MYWKLLQTDVLQICMAQSSHKPTTLTCQDHHFEHWNHFEALFILYICISMFLFVPLYMCVLFIYFKLVFTFFNLSYPVTMCRWTSPETPQDLLDMLTSLNEVVQVPVDSLCELLLMILICFANCPNLRQWKSLFSRVDRCPQNKLFLGQAINASFRQLIKW